MDRLGSIYSDRDRSVELIVKGQRPSRLFRRAGQPRRGGKNQEQGQNRGFLQGTFHNTLHTTRNAFGQDFDFFVQDRLTDFVKEWREFKISMNWKWAPINWLWTFQREGARILIMKRIIPSLLLLVLCGCGGAKSFPPIMAPSKIWSTSPGGYTKLVNGATLYPPGQLPNRPY